MYKNINKNLRKSQIEYANHLREIKKAIKQLAHNGSDPEFDFNYILEAYVKDKKQLSYVLKWLYKYK